MLAPLQHSSERRPDHHDPNQLVSYGTGGRRGSPFVGYFTVAHILAITNTSQPHLAAILEEAATVVRSTEVQS